MAEDFRIDSQIFQGQNNSPDTTGTTIFQEGIVYDFANNDREVTILAPKFEKIILLDQTLQIKTELSTKQLTEFVNQMIVRSDKSTDPTIQFMLHPKFQTHSGSNKGERVFQSEQLTYMFDTFAPSQKSIPEQYREFSDFSASLNTLVNRGWPPLARHEVNRQLASEGLLPKKVTLLIPPQAESKRRKIHLRSEHRISFHIESSRQGKIAFAKSGMEKLKSVGLGEHLKARVKP